MRHRIVSFFIFSYLPGSILFTSGSVLVVGKKKVTFISDIIWRKEDVLLIVITVLCAYIVFLL